MPDDVQVDELPAPQLPVAERSVLPHLWAMTRGRRAALAGVLVLFLCQASTAVVFPLVVGTAVDIVAVGPVGPVGPVSPVSPVEPADLALPLVLLVLAALVSGALAWIGGTLLARTVETLIARLREDYVTAALSLPRDVVEAAGTGDVVTRASDDIAEITGTVPSVLPRLAVSVFTIVAVGVGLGGLHPAYLLGFLLTVPLYALTLRWYLDIAPRTYASTRRAQSRRGEHVLGTLTHVPTVVTHRLAERQLERIGKATWETVRWSLRTRIVQNRLFGRLNAAQAIGLLAVLGVGVWLAATGASTPGQVTAAALLFLRIVAPIEALLFIMDDAQAAYASLARLIGVIEFAQDDRDEEPGDSPGDGLGGGLGDGLGDALGDGLGGESGRESDDQMGEGRPGRALVHLQDVGFEYVTGRSVLPAIDVQIDARELVAVVGATGSGKSTLAHLVTGVHAPTAGTVDRSVAFDRIASITQEPHVFTGTVRDNLTLVRAASSPADADSVLHVASERSSEDECPESERANAALERVGALHWVEAMPNGLETLVGFGGHPLTPAQAQHLALARVILLNPQFVVLDEATADTDSADMGLLDRATAAAVEDRGAIVIAHRLSQARSADRILVMHRGRIIEDGTHAGLVAAEGAYAELWRAWSSGQRTTRQLGQSCGRSGDNAVGQEETR